MNSEAPIRRLIIDGYSLLFRETSSSQIRLPSVSAARERLIRRIDRVAHALAERVEIVFDGRAPSRERLEPGNVYVIFAPSDKTADTVIEQMVHDDPDPASICVVTSDRSEIITVTATSAQAMSCKTFLELLDRAEHSASFAIKRARQSARPFTIGDVFPPL